MTRRAAVIGSGIAGLSVASILGRCGFAVELIEKTGVSAPLMRGFSRQGHYCDLGLHYVGGMGPDGMLGRFFSGIGLPELSVKALDPAGFDRISWPGRGLEFSIPTGFEAVEQALCSAFPGSLRAVRTWIETAQDICRMTPFLNPDVPPWESPATRFDRVSLSSFLEDCEAEASLIDSLGRYCASLMGAGADLTPLATHAMVLGSYIQSAHTISGGGAAVADAFMHLFGELPVRFRAASPVREISIGSDGNADGVVLKSGEKVAADIVVFTPHPSLLPEMLPATSVREAFAKRRNRWYNTPGLVLSFVGCSGLDEGGDSNSYFFFDESERENCHQLAVMAGSPPQPGLRAALCLIREEVPALFECQRDDYRRMKQELAAESVAMVRRMTDLIPGEANILEVVTPQSFERWTATSGGSAYGVLRPVRGRRLQALTPIANLFLAGQSILYPGIMGAVASGLVACCHVVGAEKVWEFLRG